MGRKKIEIKKIADEKTLLVTFAKRKVGLFNKARELSDLCDCKIAIIIFSNKSRLHHYASDDMDHILRRYQECSKNSELITNAAIIEKRAKKKNNAMETSKINLNKISRIASNGDDDYHPDDDSQDADLPNEAIDYLTDEPMKRTDTNSYMSAISVDMPVQHDEIPHQDDPMSQTSKSTCFDLLCDVSSNISTDFVDYAHQPHPTSAHNSQHIPTSIQMAPLFNINDYSNQCELSDTTQQIPALGDADPPVYDLMSPDYSKHEPLPMHQMMDDESKYKLPKLIEVNHTAAATVPLGCNGCGPAPLSFQVKEEVDVKPSSNPLPGQPLSQLDAIMSTLHGSDYPGMLGTNVTTTETPVKSTSTIKPIGKLPRLDVSKNRKRFVEPTNSACTSDFFEDWLKQRPVVENDGCGLETPVFWCKLNDGSNWETFYPATASITKKTSLPHQQLPQDISSPHEMTTPNRDENSY